MLKTKSLLLLFFLNISFSQTIYENFESDFLKDTRELKVQLPRNYNENLSKEYPLIIVLDGDYMFEAVSGSVDYLSYWGNIPESIIVGVNQINTRYDDCSVLDNIDFVPISSTANFYDFISEELIPYFDKNYRTTKFKVAVGHEATANFINYFLLNNKTSFSGFIAISPKFSYNMENYLIERFDKIKTNVFYYLASSDRDFKSIDERTKELSRNLNSSKNELISFKYKQYNNLTHYNLPIHSVSEGFEHVFETYSAINSIEYDSVLKKTALSPVKYLINKYDNIANYYDINKTILVNDIRAIEKYIEESEQFKYYKDLSKLAIDKYPKTILGSYYMGLYHERTGDAIKAMHIYRSAYTLEDIEGITKDELLERADIISNDFN
jgi:predicted alpha/beta superfamily hydrolase|tara:strand:- start:9359 stop:10504 length:1146 start_codon:yes stop_codon:yes gene_type:complete